MRSPFDWVASGEWWVASGEWWVASGEWRVVSEIILNCPCPLVSLSPRPSPLSPCLLVSPAKEAVTTARSNEGIATFKLSKLSNWAWFFWAKSLGNSLANRWILPSASKGKLTKPSDIGFVQNWRCGCVSWIKLPWRSCNCSYCAARVTLPA